MSAINNLGSIAAKALNVAAKNPALIQEAVSSLSSKMPENSRCAKFLPLIGNSLPMVLSNLALSNITKQ